MPPQAATDTLPTPPSSNGDWFSQNAPAAASTKKPKGGGVSRGAGADWFSANAPQEDRSSSPYLYSSVPPRPPSEKPGAYQIAKGGPIYNASQPDSWVGGMPQFTPRQDETPDQTMQRAVQWGRQNPDLLRKAVDAEKYMNIHTAGPAVAGTALTMAAGPQAGFWARVGLMALGAGAGEAGIQLGEHATGSPNAPQSPGQAAKQIGTQATTMGMFEAGGQLIGKAAGPIAKRFLNSRGQAIEDIFRASGPPTDPGFRSSVETAADDLGRAFQKQPIPSSAKGGIINPDMRVRAAVDAINSHLKDMYTNERAVQIGRATQAGATVPVQVDPAVLTDVTKRLTRTLPINDPSIEVAQRLFTNPNAQIPIGDADSLARAVNTMLRDYQSMTPAERAAANVTSRKLNGLKQLDQGLSQGINGRLQDLGMPGLEDYERRYAATSSVRDALQSKMNKAEAARWAVRLREFFSPSGVRGAVTSGLPGGSAGRQVESGMKTLAETAPPSPTVPAPPEPKGLLTAPPTITPPPADTSGPVSLPVPKTWSDAERAALARQQAAGQMTPPPGVAPEYSVEVTRPNQVERIGPSPSQRVESKVGTKGTAGTRTPIKGLLPEPPEQAPPPPAAQVGQLPPPGFPSQQPPNVGPSFAPTRPPSKTDLWNPSAPEAGPISYPGMPGQPTNIRQLGTDLTSRLPASMREQMSRPTPKPGTSSSATVKGPVFYRSETAPLARKFGLIPREPTAPGLVSFQDSTTGGSIEMKDGFTEQQLAEKVAAHRSAMSATPASGKSDLAVTKAMIASNRFAHEAAPATGIVKTGLKDLNRLGTLVTPAQQRTLETLMRGPQWRTMEDVDKSAAVERILGGQLF